MRLIPTLLVIAILSLVAYTIPVLKRGLGIFGGNSGAGVGIKLAQQWTAAMVAVCTVGPALAGAAGGAACLGSFIMAMITTVDARIAGGYRSGSSALPKRDSVGNGRFGPTSVVPFNCSSTNDKLTTAGLVYQGSANVTMTGTNIDTSSTAYKRDSVTNPAVYFQSEYGQHAAVGLPHLTHEDLVSRIVSATPNTEPGKAGNNTLKRGFEVDWISCSYQDGNPWNAEHWEYDETEQYNTGEITDRIANNDGWKYCVSADESTRGTEHWDESVLAENLYGAAFHGEIYFNTYGGIDGTCGDEMGWVNNPDNA